ncbi:MAG: DUF4197 domain-containing protein [Chitinophagales bacterium]
MKKIIVLLIGIVSIFNLSSCEELEGLIGNDETIAGLKEALVVSTDTSVFKTSKVNGFFGNAAIKILFPEEADNIKKILELPGINIVGEQLLNGLEVKMNEAAEKAAPLAKDIFVNTITSLTINDALSILNGEQDAATVYLRKTSDSLLYNAFYPEMKTIMASVGADVAWNEVITHYNSPTTAAAAGLAGITITPIDTDISAYTTNKALDGLFHVIAKEEAKIRTDITHRVTDLLQRVFG